MCTVSINIDEAMVRQINPGLTSRENIGNWLQHQVDLMVEELALEKTLEGMYFPWDQDVVEDDDETMDVETARKMIHETIRKEYARP